MNEEFLNIIIRWEKTTIENVAFLKSMRAFLFLSLSLSLSLSLNLCNGYVGLSTRSMPLKRKKTSRESVASVNAVMTPSVVHPSQQPQLQTPPSEEGESHGESASIHRGTARTVVALQQLQIPPLLEPSSNPAPPFSSSIHSGKSTCPPPPDVAP